MYRNFIDDCLEGITTLEYLDDYVDHWHDDYKGENSLQDFLGLTNYEYLHWLHHGTDDIFADILYCRKHHRVFSDYLVSSTLIEQKKDEKQNDISDLIVTPPYSSP